MRLKFVGVIEKSSRGCPVCGKRRSENQLLSSKTYYLSSGNKITFRAGRPVDVSDEDGEELLTYTYTDPKGQVRHVFEKV